MTRGPFLLDTGFVVALINSVDRDHRRCADVWSRISGPFVTTEGVLVETAHLVRKSPGALATAWNLVRGVGTHVAGLTTPRVNRALSLMETYRDVPMDFVDALLVSLAEEADVTQVLTLDARGFETYRLNGRTKFKLLP